MMRTSLSLAASSCASAKSKNESASATNLLSGTKLCSAAYGTRAVQAGGTSTHRLMAYPQDGHLYANSHGIHEG